MRGAPSFTSGTGGCCGGGGHFRLSGHCVVTDTAIDISASRGPLYRADPDFSNATGLQVRPLWIALHRRCDHAGPTSGRLQQ